MKVLRNPVLYSEMTANVLELLLCFSGDYFRTPYFQLPVQGQKDEVENFRDLAFDFGQWLRSTYQSHEMNSAQITPTNKI